MKAHLLSLPYELRAMIWELVLCTHDAVIIELMYLGARFKDSKEERTRFRELVEELYPPDEDVESENFNGEDDEGEDDEGENEEGENEEGENEEGENDEGENEEGENEEGENEEGENEETEGPTPPTDVSDGNSMAPDEWEGAMQRLRPNMNLPPAEYYVETDEEYYDEDEDFESEEEDPWSLPKTPKRGKYKVGAETPFNLALFRVNRQVHNETLPLFYRKTHFVLDNNGGDSIKFLRQLPPLDFRNITKISLTSGLLMGDDGSSRRAWSGAADRPRRKDPTMYTPFGELLAEMPSLSDLYIYIPYGGYEDWYCNWAYIEAHNLLEHGHIEYLGLVFCGEKTAQALRDCDESEERCFDRLMGSLKDAFDEHIFDVRYPPLRGPWDEHMLALDRKRRSKRRKYLKYESETIAWGFCRRDLDFGTTGNVQAVIGLWKDKGNEENGEGNQQDDGEEDGGKDREGNLRTFRGEFARREHQQDVDEDDERMTELDEYAEYDQDTNDEDPVPETSVNDDILPVIEEYMLNILGIRPEGLAEAKAWVNQRCARQWA